MAQSLSTRMLVVCTVLTFAPLTAASALPISATNPTDFVLPDAPGAETGGPVLSSVITFADSGLVTDLNVVVAFSHSFVGDLVIRLSHGGTTIDLLRRPDNGGGGNSVNASETFPFVFDDSAAASAADLPGPCTGSLGNGPTAECTNMVFSPLQALAAFNGVDINGTWTLTIQDFFIGDTGRLSSWTINAEIGTTTTTVPEPATLMLLGAGLVAGMVRTHRRRR